MWGLTAQIKELRERVRELEESVVKVYGIFEGDYEGEYLASVWSTRTYAEIELKRRGWDKMDRFYINEIVVDEPQEK